MNFATNETAGLSIPARFPAGQALQPDGVQCTQLTRGFPAPICRLRDASGV